MSQRRAVNAAGLPGRYAALGYRTADVLRGSARALPQDGSGDYHARYDRELLGREGDRLDRDNAVYEALLERSIETILGRDGFTLRVETGSKRVNAQVEKAFADWAEAPEVTGRFDWRDCEELSLRAFYNRGDVGVLRTSEQQVQYIESARITSGRRRVGEGRNRVDQGVETDSLGRVVAYYVADYSRDGQVRSNGARRIPAENFLLFAHRKKFSQLRGVPILTTAMPVIHRLNDVLDSEAIAWQQLARLSVAVTTEAGGALGRSLSEADDDGKDQPPDLADRVQDLEQGTFFYGLPGEEVKGIERNIPAQNFPESVRMFLRVAGMPFGIPLSVLLLDYSDTTYTSSRAELEQAFRVAIKRQRALKRRHHNPIFRWWLEWAQESGRIPLRSDYRFSWIAPEFPWIDQLKEAQAWGMRIDRGLATQRDALQSVGMELEEFHSRRFEEIVEARRLAAQASELNPEQGEVDWRYLAGYPVSKQVSASVTQEEGP